MGNGWSKYTTEDRTALTSSFNFMQCLTLAYNERAEFAGISQLSEVLRLVAKPSGFCQSFDSSLDALIPRFGKIIDGAYVAYTAESIYVELSETRLDSRLPAYKLNPLYYRLWFEQVIRVINKLIQLPIINIYPTLSGNSQYGYFGGPGDPGTDQYLIDTAIANSTTLGLGFINQIQHYSSISYWDINGGVSATVISSNATSGIATSYISGLANTTQIFDFYVLVSSVGGQFNPGSSGLSEGLQLWKGNISTAINSSNIFSLPFPLDGESLSNFPKYPMTEPWGYTRVGSCGYTLSFSYSFKSNFKFVAGS